MSTESLSSQNSALLSRIETIEGDAAAMQVAHKRSRLARLVLLLMLAMAAVVFVYLFLSLAQRFTDSGRQRNFAATALNQFFEVVDLDERAKAEQAADWDELLNQYSDMLVSEMEDLGKTSMPIVQEAFSEQINQDLPKHRAMFNEQRDLLMSNLQRRGDELLQARYEKILDQHKAILRSEFEDLDDAKMERMLAHINIAMNRLLKKYYSDEIDGQVQQLKKTFDEFAVSDPPTSGETLNQQLLGTSVELLQVKFVGDPIVEAIEEETGAAEESGDQVASEQADAQGDGPEKDEGDKDVALVKTDTDQDDAEKVDAELEDAEQNGAEQEASQPDDAGDASEAADDKADGEAEADEQEAPAKADQQESGAEADQES